jgi:hypothetical protein
MAESGAYELEHRGTVHRAADFDVLLKWAEDLRIDTADRFRPAGTEDWTPVKEEPRLNALLSPENHWKVRMASGDFTAGSFETVVRWAREGRISTDAVVEGPRTPPGGVLASALPALARQLVEPRPGDDELPRLNIDGRIYPAPDVETISRWISESRVPLDASISLAGGPWEPVANCGLFDLEKWPHAALEDAGEPPEEKAGAASRRETAPEPEPSAEPESFQPVPAPGGARPDSGPGPQDEESGADTAGEDQQGPEPFRIITGSGLEYSCEDPAELLSMLRKRRVMEYDEVRHSSLPGGSASVGAVADLVRRGKGGRGIGWKIAALVFLAAAGAYLADTLGWITLPWLP